MGGKTTRGRQKIEMKPIENESDRLVTFSKRRAGIYRKANELVALCRSNLALVIFSPSGKPFAFASPSFDSIMRRFMGQNSSQGDLPCCLLSINHEEEVQKYEQFSELKSLVESQKLLEKELEMRARVRKGKGWWDDHVNDLTIDSVRKQIRAYTELQKALDQVIAQRNGYPSSSVCTAP